MIFGYYTGKLQWRWRWFTTDATVSSLAAPHLISLHSNRSFSQTAAVFELPRGNHTHLNQVSQLLRLQEQISVSSTMNGDQIQALLRSHKLDLPSPSSSVFLHLLATATGFLFCCIGGAAWCIFVLFRRLQDHIRLNTDIYELTYSDRRTLFPGRQDNTGAGLPLVSSSHVSPSAG